MQFLFAMRVKHDATPVTNEQRAMEVAYVKEKYATDTIRQVWNRADLPGACLLIEAADESAARATVEALPLMLAGKLEIQMLVPLLPYRGFAVAGQ
jgi:muconolactone delta-isomerase